MNLIKRSQTYWITGYFVILCQLYWDRQLSTSEIRVFEFFNSRRFLVILTFPTAKIGQNKLDICTRKKWDQFLSMYHVFTQVSYFLSFPKNTSSTRQGFFFINMNLPIEMWPKILKCCLSMSGFDNLVENSIIVVFDLKRFCPNPWITLLPTFLEPPLIFYELCSLSSFRIE